MVRYRLLLAPSLPMWQADRHGPFRARSVSGNCAGSPTWQGQDGRLHPITLKQVHYRVDRGNPKP